MRLMRTILLLLLTACIPCAAADEAPQASTEPPASESTEGSETETAQPDDESADAGSAQGPLDCDIKEYTGKFPYTLQPDTGSDSLLVYVGMGSGGAGAGSAISYGCVMALVKA